MLNKQTKTELFAGEKSQKSAKSKNHSSPMSNLSWCDLNNKGNLLKVHDMCPYHKCECQKQLTFTPNQFQLEGAGFKNTIKRNFKGTEKVWNNFNKPGLKEGSPIVSAGVAAQTKNPQVAETTSNNSRSLTGGKVISLTDVYGLGLRLKVK